MDFDMVSTGPRLNFYWTPTGLLRGLHWIYTGPLLGLCWEYKHTQHKPFSPQALFPTSPGIHFSNQ